MACLNEPLTGDPQTFARVKWSRLVDGDDVSVVFANAWDQALLPTRHEELANPMYARSAQEWFNKLPDDTAKSIVNLRRSMLSVYKKQTTPLARPKQYQPLPTPTATSTVYDLGNNAQGMAYQDPNMALAQYQQQLFDQAEGAPPYPFYQAGQQLANIIPFTKKQTANKLAPGVLPLYPDGPTGTGYPLYPLPPPGHPMVPPGGMLMPGPIGPDGKPTMVMFGPDGKPIQVQIGPDGRPIPNALVDDPSVPDEPAVSRWYESAGPFAGFEYQWQRIDTLEAKQAEERAKQEALEQRQQMLQQQILQQSQMNQQMMMAMGGAYPPGMRPPIMAPSPMGPYPMGGAPGMAGMMPPGMLGMQGMQGMQGAPGMPGVLGMPGAPGMAGMPANMQASQMGMMGAGMGAPGMPSGMLMPQGGVPPGPLLTQTASQLPPSSLAAMRQSMQLAAAAAGANPQLLQGSMQFAPGSLGGYQTPQRHPMLAGSVSMAPGSLQGASAGGASVGDPSLRLSTPRLPPQGEQFGQMMPAVGQQQTMGLPQGQGQLGRTGQDLQAAMLTGQGQLGRTGQDLQSAMLAGQGQLGRTPLAGQSAQAQPGLLQRQGQIGRSGPEQEAAALAAQGALAQTAAGQAGQGQGGQGQPPALLRQGQIGRAGAEQAAAAAAGQAAQGQAGQAPPPALTRQGQISRSAADQQAIAAAAAKAAGDDGRDEEDYSQASRSAIKGQGAAAAGKGGLGKLPTLGSGSSLKESAVDPSKGDKTAPATASKLGGLTKSPKLPSTTGKDTDTDEAPIFTTKASTGLSQAGAATTATGVRPGTPVKSPVLAGKPSTLPAKSAASKIEEEYTIDEVDDEDQSV